MPEETHQITRSDAALIGTHPDFMLDALKSPHSRDFRSSQVIFQPTPTVRPFAHILITGIHGHYVVKSTTELVSYTTKCLLP